jgi:hypothetical protein
MLQAGGWLPEDMAIIPAGLELAAAVADVDRASLSDEDLVRLAQARQRLAAHVQAQLLADLHAIGQRADRQVCRTEQHGDVSVAAWYAHIAAPPLWPTPTTVPNRVCATAPVRSARTIWLRTDACAGTLRASAGGVEEAPTRTSSAAVGRANPSKRGCRSAHGPTAEGVGRPESRPRRAGRRYGSGWGDQHHWAE